MNSNTVDPEVEIDLLHYSTNIGMSEGLYNSTMKK